MDIGQKKRRNKIDWSEVLFVYNNISIQWYKYAKKLWTQQI